MEILTIVYLVSFAISLIALILIVLTDGTDLTLGGLILIFIISGIPIVNTLFSVAGILLFITISLLDNGILNFKIIKGNRR